VAVRPVLRLPHPLLAERAAPVGCVDERALRLATDLVDTMRAAPACVGLAATQIGVLLRALVVDVTGHPKARSCHGLIVLFDPRLVAAAEPEVAREGCMSIPDLTGDVERPTRVVVEGLSPEARTVRLGADAFEARALLHELDHLDGMVFLDRVVGPHAVHPRKVYRAPGDRRGRR
jgi:peptide deformylase